MLCTFFMERIHGWNAFRFFFTYDEYRSTDRKKECCVYGLHSFVSFLLQITSYSAEFRHGSSYFGRKSNEQEAQLSRRYRATLYITRSG